MSFQCFLYISLRARTATWYIISQQVPGECGSQQYALFFLREHVNESCILIGS